MVFNLGGAFFVTVHFVLVTLFFIFIEEFRMKFYETELNLKIIVRCIWQMKIVWTYDIK